MAESAGSMEGKKRKALAALCLLNVIDDDRRHWKRGKTKDWMKRREEKGYVSNIITELSIEDTAAYKEMMRMSHADFLFLLSLVERDITPQAILGGSPTITPKSRLALTIRFLATGESYRSLRFQFRISTSAISYIVNEVCAAIVKNVGPLYLKVPSSVEEWDEIAARFNELWHYPNCVGALDGKHIVIQPPANSGSHYYNYKHSHSIVLLALAGPNYECLYADVGTNGRVSDGGVWNKCDLSKAIEEKKLLLPEPKCLPSGIEKVPYVVVADEAFALQNFLMKPYPQCGLTDDKRIYNYRHSRARRFYGNLFGIIANR
ncbi:uncharacterized protein LOC135694808 [Rhopilema esculentum]|uniref:uncharacterized protein LOC135694808 n=1 Tax=Rhopilema esculentum TaxID=499914 RepID=UPI0031E0D548